MNNLLPTKKWKLRVLIITSIFCGFVFNEEVPYPYISTKAKAQKLVGLNKDKLNAEKQEFLKTVLTEWKSRL